jgi:CheY-like chemotaxis protein
MASGIVHDFNNALTSILAHTELALGPLEQGQPYFDDLTHIRTAALDAAAVVRRLRHLGPNGRQPDEREVADLREIARLVPSLARPRWLKASQCDGVSFEIVVQDGPVPSVYVAVAEIREVLLNLLFNAVDAMPGGGRITIATSTDPNGWAVISVTDEGIGMSDETIRQLFRPFFSTKGDRGSGLGLSACHTIAVRHGARLDVQSEPGVGTTFTLAIPPAPELQTGTGHTSTPTLPYRPVASQRILLVDDQPEVRASVGDMLRASGHEVEVVESGEAAVAYGSMHRIDVLITDLGMPDMNGLEVARRFRVVAPAVPVILLTGWGLDADTTPPGNVAFVLTKPVTLKNLNDAVGRCKPEPVSARRTKCS